VRSNVGHYRIEGLIGRGGMGVVYSGMHEHLGRAVAIKELAPELTRQPEFKERFFAEAKTQALLHHPNIVAVYDLVEETGEYFIIMEFVPGEGLDQLLKSAAGRGMELGDALGVFGQILTALDYAHSEGVIHRDVKPSNALITAQGRAKLMDFGIALLIGDKRLTASQSSIGTPTYMSPEQIMYPRTVDHRSDIYSAAVVLFEMLAGQPPFDADTEYSIKKLHIESPPPDLAALKPDLPPGVLRAIGLALSKTPDDRFQSAGAFLRALQEAAPAVLVAPPLGATSAAPKSVPEPRAAVLDSAQVSSTSTDARPRGGASYRPVSLHGRGLWALGAVAAAVLVGAALVLVLALRGQRTNHSDSPSVEAQVAAQAAAPSTSLHQPAPPSQSVSAPQPPPTVLSEVQPPTSALSRAVPVPVETSLPVADPQIAKPKKPHSRPPEVTQSQQPESVVRVAPPPPPPLNPTTNVEKPVVAQAAPTHSSDLTVGDLSRLKEVVYTLASLANDVYDTAEHDPQKTNAALRLLGDFKSSADELKSVYQKATGTGMKGIVGRFRLHASQEADQMELKVQAKELVRRAREIDDLMKRDPMGSTAAEFWSEIKKYIAMLDGLFHN
jgi:serine/threonine protein kinase